MTKIKCTHCSKEVYKLNKVLLLGEVISASHFSGINGAKSPKEGEAIVCPNCGLDLLLSIEQCIRDRMASNEE